jgi:hypothetical protein
MQPTIHFQKKPDILISVASFFGNVVWVAFFILSGPLLFLKNPVLLLIFFFPASLLYLKKLTFSLYRYTIPFSFFLNMLMFNFLFSHFYFFTQVSQHWFLDYNLLK